MISLRNIPAINADKILEIYSFFTEGRTGQLALIVGLFVLALISFKNKFKAVFISLVLASVLLGGAYTLSTTFQNRVADATHSIANVIENQNYCSSWGARVGAYITAKDIVLEYPVLGAGIDDNMEEFRMLLQTKYPHMACIKELPHMHNQYLQILTQLGFVGLFVFLVIFYMIGNMKIENKEYSSIKYMYLVVLSLSFIPEVLFHRAFSLSLFALIIGLLLSQYRAEDEI